MHIENLLKRKITTTFVTTSVTSLILAFWYMNSITDEAALYQLGSSFIGWLVLYSLYIGAIVLFYGNLVSIGVDYLQKKWFVFNSLLYILLHGFFGLAIGLVFQNLALALAGMIVGTFYALIDRWVYIRAEEQLSAKPFYLLPVLACGLLTGYFHNISEPMPPFTKEDAVDYATDGEGALTDDFPQNIGKWHGVVGGYHVERETSAYEIGKEKYIIMFTERWEKGKEKGSWNISYNVDRQSLTLQASEGENRPY